MYGKIKLTKSDERFIEELVPILFPKWTKKSKRVERLIKYMSSLGTFNIPSMLEAAISITGNLERVRGNQRDFVDGSDAKKTTTRWRSNRTVYSASVSKVHNKIGVLRVMCYNKLLDKFYYFLIPRAAYNHIERTSNIEIPFMKDGTPQRGPANPNEKIITNWWDYEVASFADLSKPMPEHDITKAHLVPTSYSEFFAETPNVSSPVP